MVFIKIIFNRDSAIKIGFYVLTAGNRGPSGRSGLTPKRDCFLSTSPTKSMMSTACAQDKGFDGRIQVQSDWVFRRQGGSLEEGNVFAPSCTDLLDQNTLVQITKAHHQRKGTKNSEN